MRRRAPVVLLAAAAVALVATAPAAAANLGFARAQYVDREYPGGEPLVMADPIHHTLVYTSHEGTTHIYRPGLSSATTFTYGSQYRNQVKIWTSRDNGRTWRRVDVAGGFVQNPGQNTGFSDPDLTQDAGGRIYNTGINLANDALFSSADGGITWDRGTPNCHNGDRPWLAGAKRDEVFLATNTLEQALSHQIFRSTDGGNSCSTQGIPDSGTLPDGTDYSGNGKLFYDARRDSLVEPVSFSGTDAQDGLGVGTWKRGDPAFTPHKAVTTSVYAHWPMIALDDAGGLYMVWDDDPRQPNSNGGCDGARTPLPNTIKLIHSPDFGRTWGTPVTLARPAGKRVLWPWVVAGDKGRLSVVWYETDKVVDLACEKAKLTVRAAYVARADEREPYVETVDAIGRPIADNDLCQSGTTCVATGEDRRLGDFFTNAIDERGCAMIATADTTSPDPVTGGQRPISLPLFAQQDSGPALRGGGDCSGAPGALGLPAPRRCTSRRSFRIRLRHPRGDPLRRAVVYVNRRRVRVLRGRRLRARVNLRGLPRGRYTIRIQARTRSGKRLTELRRYRTCTPRSRRR
jgi:hypothetical protein